MSIVGSCLASFEVLVSPRVWILPFQLCWVRCLSLLLDSYPFSPFSWCSRCSSRRRFISSFPPQDNNAISKASHLARVSVRGKPKLRLNSLLKIFLYVYSDIFVFWGLGRGKKKNEYLKLTIQVKIGLRYSAKQTLAIKHYSVFVHSIFFANSQLPFPLSILKHALWTLSCDYNIWKWGRRNETWGVEIR